jgi:tRNA G18 (ribose-2'-O)-methylase SpoU
MVQDTPDSGTLVRCPAESCRASFSVAQQRLGKSMACPSCARRMTARPLAIEAQLVEQQARIAGSTGVSIERLPFVVLLDDLRSLWNVGSIFRTADACGVRELILAGITGYPPRPEIAKTALGAEDAVAWSYRADAREALQETRASGYATVAVECTPRAVSLEAMEWPEAVCLVMGNEVAGVSSPVMDACDHHVSIPMRGVKDSLNVAVAFGIVAHHLATWLERVAPLERKRCD